MIEENPAPPYQANTAAAVDVTSFSSYDMTLEDEMTVNPIPPGPLDLAKGHRVDKVPVIEY